MALRKWKGQKAVRQIASDLEPRMEAVGAHLEREVKRALSGPSPSRPGEPPGLVTGVLQGGVTHRVERQGLNIIGVIGVANVLYAAPLEFGTSRVASRPFLRPTIQNNKGKIKQILGAR